MKTFKEYIIEAKTPTHAVDLDGTFANYKHYKVGQIGKIIPKMLERVQEWLKNGDNVIIFTARAHNPKDKEAIRKWLKLNGLPNLKITNIKTPDITDIWDDRAKQVIKNTGEVVGDETIEEKHALAAGLLAGSMLLPMSAEAGKQGKKHAPIEAKYTQLSIAEVVAKTLWQEARGEGKEGIDAVASVIYNRAKGNPEKIRNVITRPYQFESWAKGPPIVKIKNETDQKIWDYCLKIGQSMENNTFKPIGKFTHFYNPSVVSPKWARNKEYVQIGRQRFLNA